MDNIILEMFNIFSLLYLFTIYIVHNLLQIILVSASRPKYKYLLLLFLAL